MSPPQSTIHIIGAGLSGLVLAHALRARGILAVTVLERDASAVLAKRHGYAITLQPRTYGRLASMLGMDDARFRERVAVRPASSRAGADVRINRRELEAVLRQGVDVRCGCEVKVVRQGNEGKVQVELAGGDVLETGLLVAADGAHSRVRQAVLPDSAPLAVLPYVAFNGKRRVGREDWEAKYADSFSTGETVLERRIGGAVLRVSVDEIESDRISMNYTYSRLAKQRRDDDALYKPNRPNASAKDIPNELFDELRGLEAELDGALLQVFRADAVKEDRLLHWLMRSLLIRRADLVRQAEAGVLFIGDAVHHAPIIGSEGANEAILDAIELADFLAGGRKAAEWYDETRYQQRWSRHLEEGVRRLAEQHRIDKAKV